MSCHMFSHPSMFTLNSRIPRIYIPVAFLLVWDNDRRGFHELLRMDVEDFVDSLGKVAPLIKKRTPTPTEEGHQRQPAAAIHHY